MPPAWDGGSSDGARQQEVHLPTASAAPEALSIAIKATVAPVQRAMC